MTSRPVWEGLEAQTVDTIRANLRSLGRDPDEAEGIVRSLEATIALMGPRFQRAPDPRAGAAANLILEALDTLPIGSPEELNVVRRVLARIVRVTGYSPEGGRSSPRARDRAARTLAFREWILAILRDARLPWRGSSLAAEVLTDCERKAFGDAPDARNAIRRLRKRGRKT